MKFSDGLFLEVAREVAAQDYPDIAFDDRIIDALCMQLIQAPERFDVLVLPNLYGDLVAELGAGSDRRDRRRARAGTSVGPADASSRCSRRRTARRPGSPARTGPTRSG